MRSDAYPAATGGAGLGVIWGRMSRFEEKRANAAF